MHFLLPNQHRECTTYILELVEKKTPMQVVFQKPKRSTKQNSTFHDNVGILAQHSWYTPYQMKLIIKEGITNAKILEMATKIVTAKWIVITEYKSTADLDTKDFWLLMDYVFQIWATLWLKMNIPDDWLLEYAKEIFT